jgi:DNA-binding NarL/FixJ family response regulator
MDSMVPKRRILLVDDHPLLRRGIGQLINEQEDLVVCGEAEDRAGALAAIEKTHPHLAVIDLSLKDNLGLELIKDCSTLFPSLLVLVLSMHEEKFYAERVLRAGARGYIMKAEASDKVLTAIREVLNGRVFVSPYVADRILDKATGAPRLAEGHQWGELTDREAEVFALIGKGYGSQQISKRLHLSVKTIETHRANIKQKLGLSTSQDLLQNAINYAQQAG